MIHYVHYVIYIVILYFLFSSQIQWPVNGDYHWITYNWDGSSKYVYTWELVQGALSYSISCPNMLYDMSDRPLGKRATVKGNQIKSDSTAYIQVTANFWFTSITGRIAPCFLKGSPVAMADGTFQNIEDVLIGQNVIGAFGEINSVLALHRPLLGPHKMVEINDHVSSAHHPHIDIHKQFYCADVGAIDDTYGHFHDVIGPNGPESQFLKGLHKKRLNNLQLGTKLKTIDGFREVVHIRFIDMPQNTQLYNLVVSGSHTYHVNGYAVTGWPNEDDFDYDAWNVPNYSYFQ